MCNLAVKINIKPESIIASVDCSIQKLFNLKQLILNRKLDPTSILYNMSSQNSV